MCAHHMRFVASFYHEQIEDQRYCLQEHLKYSSAWQLPCVKIFEGMPKVEIAHGDKCQFGAEAPTGPTPDCQ